MRPDTGAHPFIVVAFGIGSAVLGGWPFTLTPALSHWERENRRPSLGGGRRGIGRRIFQPADGIPVGFLSQREGSR